MRFRHLLLRRRCCRLLYSVHSALSHSAPASRRNRNRLLLFLLLVVFLGLLAYSNNANNSSNESSGVPIRNSAVDAQKCLAVLPHRPAAHYVRLDGITYPQVVPSYLNRSIDFECLNRSRQLKTIYLWTSYRIDPHFYFELGARTPFERYRCPVTACQVAANDPAAYNRSELVLFEADTLLGLFGGHRSRNRQQQQQQRYAMPTHRAPNQSWVLVNVERPHVAAARLRALNSQYQLLASYHPFAHFNAIYHSNMQFEWTPNASFDVRFDYHAHKTANSGGNGSSSRSGSGASAYAVISNCRASERLAFVRELARWMRVDVYGQCGTHSCPVSAANVPFNQTRKNSDGGDDCKEYLAGRYLFFLAFENAMCVDYITEKFFRALNYETVPVVMGAGEYARYVPRSAYVDGRHFASARQLAAHLSALARDPVRYNAHFAWRRHVSFRRFEPPGGWRRTRDFAMFNNFCDMCVRMHLGELLQSARADASTIDNLHEIYDKRRNCRPYRLREVQNRPGPLSSN